MHCSLAVAVAAALANAAGCSAVTPLEKVVTLLSDLRTKVSQEGSQEAETYGKFACFCKDTMAAKASAISTGEVGKNDLQARLNDASTRRNQEDTSIQEKQQAILTLEQEIATLRASRHAEALQYAKSEVDLTRALQGLEAAIQMLKSARTATGLVELKKMSGTVRQAVSMAEALTPTDISQHLMTALAQLDEVPSSVYAFHADDIVTTLEGLKTQFFNQKVGLDGQETQNRQAFESLLQNKESAISGHQTALESHRQNKAAETQTIALASQDLTVTSAQLLDDQRYLAELGARCNEKALAWDRRTDARANELVALTRALEILQTSLVVSGAAAPTLIQLHKAGDGVKHTFGRGTKRSRATERMAMVSAHPMLLVQLERDRSEQGHLQSHLRGGRAALPSNWREEAAALLRTKAGDLHSALLLRLAGQVSEDPFGKVKQLIQELIERLLREAQAETSHKGWCDQQVTMAEEARDRSADSIQEVNTRLEAGEARRAKLAVQIQEVDEELRSINATLLNSTETRQQEKNESAAAIQDAEQARDAVALAIDTLDKFYREAANNATSLLELLDGRRSVSGRSLTASSSSKLSNASNATGAALGGNVEDDAPAVGFDSPYIGAIGAKEGVLGLLEVIRSDFERTISETREAEVRAEQIYNELQTSAGASLAEKSEARASWSRSLLDADAADQEDRSTLARLQATLDGALDELEALRSSCMDSGTSAEERKMQREEEMEALRKVLCIIEQHGVGGIESC